MPCEWTEKVSLYLDDELSSEEATAVRVHVGTCLPCRTAYNDFVRLRAELKSTPAPPAPMVQYAALHAILGEPAPPWWRRRLTIPAPVFALTVLLALVGGYVLPRITNRTAPTTSQTRQPAMPQAPSKPEPVIDFSRYDHGGRATLVVVKKTVLPATGARS
ncbi:MAG: zf-HC2 domain-containing protein [Blastocatellia bacterium]|nr:zf-HC2 domain-containing protein [Blastocatellia bacterium]